MFLAPEIFFGVCPPTF